MLQFSFQSLILTVFRWKLCWWRYNAGVWWCEVQRKIVLEKKKKKEKRKWNFLLKLPVTVYSGLPLIWLWKNVQDLRRRGYVWCFVPSITVDSSPSHGISMSTSISLIIEVLKIIAFPYRFAINTQSSHHHITSQVNNVQSILRYNVMQKIICCHIISFIQLQYITFCRHSLHTNADIHKTNMNWVHMFTDLSWHTIEHYCQRERNGWDDVELIKSVKSQRI